MADLVVLGADDIAFAFMKISDVLTKFTLSSSEISVVLEKFIPSPLEISVRVQFSVYSIFSSYKTQISHNSRDFQLFFSRITS